ncbi:MAG TPA: hypothetical protein V6D17_20320 [Candidatus Obscuribacterales bacterium]
MADKHAQQTNLSLAHSALDEKDAADSEALYTQLIERIEHEYDNSQKEVAAELSRLAKQIESAGFPEKAMEFKQRTCEVMLKLNMSRRRRDRAQSHPLPPFQQAKEECFVFNSLEYLYIGSADFERDLQFYKVVLKAEQV